MEVGSTGASPDDLEKVGLSTSNNLKTATLKAVKPANQKKDDVKQPQKIPKVTKAATTGNQQNKISPAGEMDNMDYDETGLDFETGAENESNYTDDNSTDSEEGSSITSTDSSDNEGDRKPSSKQIDVDNFPPEKKKGWLPRGGPSLDLIKDYVVYDDDMVKHVIK